MARTTLFDALRRALRLARIAGARGIPSRELVELARAERRAAFDRRRFLQAAAGVAAVGALPISTTACGSDDKTGPRVVIAGAGLAGLHAAYRLRQAGVRATVYEAADRTGGRTYTARGMFGNQIAELGGELIDSGHATMMALASEFELTLDDLRAGAPMNFKEEIFYFGGREVPESEIVDAFRPVAMMISDLVASAESDDTVFETTDNMSLADWLAALPGMDSTLREILRVAYTGEYGLEASEQSVFNLFYLIDYESPEPFRIFGDSDERYHLHTGSDSIATKLAENVSGQIETGAKLVAIAKNANGTYKLSFTRAMSTFDVEADHVIITLPFTTLRSVALDMAGIADDKREEIQTLGYGTNAKLMGHFSTRVWREQHNASGSSFTDNGIQSTWDTSRGQDGPNGLITNFVGGQLGVSVGAGSAEERYLEVLPKLDQMFPGAAAAYLANTAVRMHWPTAPNQLGSYSCYKPGQWAYYGIEGRREGNLHFAGEHCSADFQGFMEGAAETGAAAAIEVLVDLGMMPSAQMLRAALPAKSRRRGRRLARAAARYRASRR